MMNKLIIHYLEGDLIVALFFCIRNTYIKYFIRIIFCVSVKYLLVKKENKK